MRLEVYNNSIELEILQASYWEHFKQAKDLARYLNINDIKRIKIDNECNIILNKITKLKNDKYEETS